MIKVRHSVAGLFVLFVMFFLSNDLFAQLSALNQAGGFESDLPGYWTKGKSTGATLSWATDQSRSMGHSLKIVKSAATTDSVYWMTPNDIDMWAPQILKNVDILLGAYVMTQNVNTNPANDDAKWWVSYIFYDSAGAKIGEVKLPVNQTSASSQTWMADTNAVGQTILPKDAWKLVIMFVAGKSATGTVWADDFILTGRNGAWAGQNWNTSVGVPTGWNYWLPPNGGNDGKLANGFENTRVTNEEKHSGTNSLKFDIPLGTHDAWIGTQRYPLDQSVKAGDMLRISVWIKASRLVPDSARNNQGTWSVGFTPIFHSGWKSNDAYDEIGASDLTFMFPSSVRDTAFDWTQYSIDYQVPNDPKAKAFSVRLHVYSRFQGKVYFDDLTVQKVVATAVKNQNVIANRFNLDQNYPNPFNPVTTIRYSIPERAIVTLKVYDMLGREVRTLINTEQNAGVYNILWNGDNNYGEKVASGTYIYRVEAGSFSQVKKMLLLK